MSPKFPGENVLLDWKTGEGWTLTDALSGIIVLGATGSGKSSGPLRALRAALLASTRALPGGAGFLVLCAKVGEADEWEAAARAHGRGADVVRITAGGPHCFNFLDWLASWGQGGERGPLAATDFLEEVASGAQPANSGGSSDENAFFEGAHRAKLLNIIALCQLAGLLVSVPLMRAISSSVPHTLAQAHDRAWQQGSACYAALQEAARATHGDPAAQADLAECRRYFLLDYPALSDRTRGVIDIMFSALTGPLLRRPLRPLFCERTTVTPEACCDGAIILVDLPIQEYGPVGAMAALIWKRAFQLMVMRRHGPPGTLRPVCLVADEVQAFLTRNDPSYTSVARGGGGVTIFLTQSVANIRDAMGSADRAEALTSNLQTVFICQSTGETARWASELVGERYVSITGVNMGRGGGLKDGVIGEASSHAGISRHEEKRRFLEASEFQRLRRGGPHAGYLVDAVVYCGGKLFHGENGEPVPYKLLSFRQR